MSNTLIVSAVGNKSKLIRKQILCDIYIEEIKYECVFLIIPDLIKPCILGTNFLQETGCLIDMGRRIVELRREDDEATYTVPMMHIKVVDVEEEEEIIRNIDKKIESIECGDKGTLERLREVLVRNRSLFRECPGRIEGYVHEFQVTDQTPYFQRGWPVPLAYKGKVDGEIRKMLRYGVIERCNSAYINPLVTVIKKDGSVRLCLDARKVNSVTIPDYEGAPPINDILAR